MDGLEQWDSAVRDARRAISTWRSDADDLEELIGTLTSLGAGAPSSPGNPGLSELTDR
jgi:hypothetical protein